MKVLYVATDQTVPGRTGGSVHVLEVGRGLAARGHDVHAVVHAAAGAPDEETRDGVHWHRVGWWPPHRLFRYRARTAVARIASDVRPEVIMERYYNFGGEGVAVARERGVPAVLEVNSPVVDHPGSLKGLLDALALVRPLRRYREGLCRDAAALVAPIREIVPEAARAKTEVVSWGANVEAFHPERRSAALRKTWGASEEDVVVLFSGSFRPWHGVHVLEAAARSLSRRGDLRFVFVGGSSRDAGVGFRGRRLGTVPYEEMPEVVASADVGVAPYDTARLGQLRLGFYWSPLKIFEYMASGLPTVTIRRPPLDEIVREGLEGLHFPDGDPRGLARTLERLADDAPLRARLGARARERVVLRYSWAAHCAQLEAVLRRIVA
jgi:glycosyltransferase involved in cell wall biosynthesis